MVLPSPTASTPRNLDSRMSSRADYVIPNDYVIPSLSRDLPIIVSSRACRGIFQNIEHGRFLDSPDVTSGSLGMTIDREVLSHLVIPSGGVILYECVIPSKATFDVA